MGGIIYGIYMNRNITKDGFGASQDIEEHLKYAHAMRTDIQQNTTVRSFAIIPDIVAIDIYSKHKIDVHSEELMSNPAQLSKLQRIIRQEYPRLLTGGITNRFNMGGQ
jgi:hypothetical protein